MRINAAITFIGKPCVRCGSNLRRRRPGQPNRKSGECARCKKVADKARYKANPTKIQAYAKAWRLAHPKNKRETGWREIGVRFAPDGSPWNHEAFLSLGEKQGWRDPITEQAITPKTARVDHDHATGVVRGLVSNGTNTMLIGAHTLETARRLVRYLDPRDM